MSELLRNIGLGSSNLPVLLPKILSNPKNVDAYGRVRCRTRPFRNSPCFGCLRKAKIVNLILRAAEWLEPIVIGVSL
jgi:hypothetical protein